MAKYTEKILSELNYLDLEHIIKVSPVFFVGSFISVFDPTNLPTGKLFGSMLYEYIFKETNIENEFLYKKYSEIPFEALMELCPNKGSALDALLKLFSTKSYNEFHKLLTDMLLNSKISALITPDYDLTFDYLLQNKDCAVIKTETDYIEYCISKQPSVYFKIHGTAEADLKDSIVYTLSQEGNLVKWKGDLLHSLTENRTIIFVGYSGRDFDICPLIAYEQKYDRIIWLHFGEKEDLSAYACQLLESKAENILILGDLSEFLQKTFKVALTAKSDVPVFAPDQLFNLSPIEIVKWRVAILDRLAYPQIGFNVLKSYQKHLDEKFYNEHLGNFYGHEGSYKKASDVHLRIAKCSNNSVEERIKSWVIAAGYINTYGNYYLAAKYVAKAEELYDKHADDLDSEILILRMTLTFEMRTNQIYEMLRLSKLQRRLKKKAAVIYNRLYELLIGSGLWDERQNVTLMAERLNIKDQRRPLSLDSDLGFTNLGMPSMAMIKYKDSIRYGTKEQHERSLKKIDYVINELEVLGIYTEVWKLSRLKIKKQKLNKLEMEAYFEKWRCNLHKPQYTVWLRLIYLLDFYKTRIQFSLTA